MRGWLVTALLPTPWRAPLLSCFANGSLGVRRIWWLLPCLHLLVPLCIVVCPVGACLTVVCGGLSPVALLLAFLQISGSFFCCWHAHRCWCAAPGGGSMSLPASPCGCRLSHFQLGGTRGTGHFCTCLQIYKLACHWCLLGLFWGNCDALLLLCILGCWGAPRLRTSLRAIHASELGTRVSPPPGWFFAVTTNGLIRGFQTLPSAPQS